MIDRLGGFFGSRDAEDELEDEHVDEADADLDPPPSPVGQDERRMQVRAYNHWASLLGDRTFPDIADLEPEKLDDFGPYSVLLDFSDGIEDPLVGFVGTELAEECGHDGTIKRLLDVPSRSVLSRITDHYLQIIANQAPIGFEAEFVNERGGTVLYRGILLPYSSDDETVDFIYGVINWKETADQQTADELLLEIDQALGDDESAGVDNADEKPIETAEMLTVDAPSDNYEDILELETEAVTDDAGNGSLPQPVFGQDEGSPDIESAARPDRSVDALGNPIGALSEEADLEEIDEEDDDFDSGMKTAADYGLPDWDDDEAEEDVDDLVDPLADDEMTSSLTSLVSRGGRAKKSVDLSSTAPALSIPRAYEPKPDDEPAPESEAEIVETDPDAEQGDLSSESPDAAAEDTTDDNAFAIVETDEPQAAVEPVVEETDIPEEANETEEPLIDEDESPEGLYDCLAAAREMAQAAQTTEDRSRKALYAAVGRAYDFSLEAQDNQEDYDELLVDNGLTFQDRAPMTPIVKLVFGADYDKTRLTEYAAVLMHAHRVGVERGELATFLRDAEGGLKGVVNSERRARKEEQGKPVEEKKAVRPNLAKKLRALDALSLADLDEDGAEFALVMVRRTEEGELQVVGEVPEDVPLVERAARKLLG